MLAKHLDKVNNPVEIEFIEYAQFHSLNERNDDNFVSISRERKRLTTVNSLSFLNERPRSYKDASIELAAMHDLRMELANASNVLKCDGDLNEDAITKAVAEFASEFGGDGFLLLDKGHAYVLDVSAFTIHMIEDVNFDKLKVAVVNAAPKRLVKIEYTGKIDLRPSYEERFR